MFALLKVYLPGFLCWIVLLLFCKSSWRDQSMASFSLCCTMGKIVAAILTDFAQMQPNSL